MDREQTKHHLHNSLTSEREILIEILIELKNLNEKLEIKK